MCTFADKGRQALLDWFVHSRKLGWDTYFICQSPGQIDKQVRESLVELSVSCKRLDKIRIPFIGVLTKNLLGFELRPPKVHVATVRYGVDRDAIVNDRWSYLGKDLYEGYDTRQVFKEDYSEGLFSYLPPWTVKGRYMAHIRRRPSEWLRDLLKPAKPVVLSIPEKRGLVLLLSKLPANDRVYHFNRLQSLGAI